MRYLVWYFRTAFCNHEWEHEEKTYEVTDYPDTTKVLKRNFIVSATCKKCGWHRKYKKF